MNDYAEDLRQLGEASARGDVDFLKSMHKKACLELAIFEGLPCNGRLHALPPPERDRRCVSNCDAEFASRCQMRDHRACPRVLRDKVAHLQPSASDRASELRRALVPGAIANLLGHKQERSSRALIAASEWSASGKRILLLSGGPRAGKTVAACWLIHHLAKSALFFNPSLLFQYGADAGYQARSLACGLLIIDDVGTESGDASGKFASRLEVLVCTRFDAGDRTVLTTNLPAGEFSKRYGQRIASRIQTGGTFSAVGATQFVDRQPGEEG